MPVLVIPALGSAISLPEFVGDDANLVVVDLSHLPLQKLVSGRMKTCCDPLHPKNVTGGPWLHSRLPHLGIFEHTLHLQRSGTQMPSSNESSALSECNLPP